MKVTIDQSSSVSLSLSQNTQVTEAWNKIAQSFKCTAIEGKLTKD